MSVITECSHGMPTPSSCVLCMDDGAVAPPSKPTIPDVHTMVARHTSDCPGCGTPIHPGQMITGWGNHWSHTSCAE